MAVQLVSYDLRSPGRNYERLFEAIRRLGSRWHCLKSVWLVETSLSGTQIRDALSPHLDANDLLVVTKLSGDWATVGLTGECVNWLRQHLAA